VRRAKEYVRAGDIYQANLSRPWEVQIRGSAARSQLAPAAALYQRLCAANPAPFAALAQWRGVAILSSSPERLVRVVGRRIDTRPIAGTRPRSHRPDGDRHEMTELAAHPKERAEHIMLIDLERNDLGRVCEPGTVRVDEFMTIESYTHVHHIVSNVSGELKGESRHWCVTRGVSGRHHHRLPQIPLHADHRGARRGRARCVHRLTRLPHARRPPRSQHPHSHHEPRRAAPYVSGRAGIVADSDPERELEETRAKARGLLAALGGPE